MNGDTFLRYGKEGKKKTEGLFSQSEKYL